VLNHNDKFLVLMLYPLMQDCLRGLTFFIAGISVGSVLVAVFFLYINGFKSVTIRDAEPEGKINNNSNLIPYYLYAKSTARRPITDTAQFNYT
jgi:hypothetical protein